MGTHIVGYHLGNLGILSCAKKVFVILGYSEPLGGGGGYIFKYIKLDF